MTIWFDLDGTLVDLYAVDGWLEYLMSEDTFPYDEAKVLLNMSLLARYLNKLQSHGYKLGIISWTSKAGTSLYNGEVALSKLVWLHKHLNSVQWDEIKIVEYGTAKSTFKNTQFDILFDDEEPNRNDWGETAYEPHQIFEVLKELVKGE